MVTIGNHPEWAWFLRCNGGPAGFLTLDEIPIRVLWGRGFHRWTEAQEAGLPPKG